MSDVLCLEELTIENLRSIKGPETIVFKDRDDLMQFDGVNEDTGGSSGAGKSSAAISIDYLFNTANIPATALKPWDGVGSPTVTGKFTKGNSEIIIKRGVKCGLSVTIDGVETSGNSKICEEKIDEIIGLPRSIFKVISHKRQGEGSFFVEMKPKAKYEFLVKVLGLEKLNEKIPFIEQEYKEKEKTVGTIEFSIENEIKAIDEFEEILDSKVKPIVDFKEEDIATLEENKAILESQALDNKKLWDSELAKLIEPIQKTEVSFNDAKINELLSQKNIIEQNIQKANADKNNIVSKIQSEINELNSTKNNSNLALQKAKTIGQQIVSKKQQRDEMIETSKCHTCKQSWTGEGADKLIAKLTEEISNLTQDAIKLKGIIDKGVGVDEQISIKTKEYEEKRQEDVTQVFYTELKSIQDLINEENNKKSNMQQLADSKFLKEKNYFLQKKGEIDSKFSSCKAEIESGINSIRANLNDLISKRNNYNSNLSNYENEVERLKLKIGEKKENLKRSQEARDRMLNEIDVAKESHRCLKTFILNTFQDTLGSIGEMATEIVNSIPNVATTSIFFESFKETNSGNIKNEVNAIVSKGGVEDVPLKALCGGESAAIGLAIDLAVIDIIESKTGLGVDFYIMDEPFNGLDSICRQECLFVIKSVDTTKRIIIIDHCDELKEMVSDVVKVVKKNDISTIVS